MSRILEIDAPTQLAEQLKRMNGEDVENVLSAFMEGPGVNSSLLSESAAARLPEFCNRCVSPKESLTMENASEELTAGDHEANRTRTWVVHGRVRPHFCSESPVEEAVALASDQGNDRLSILFNVSVPRRHHQFCGWTSHFCVMYAWILCKVAFKMG